MKPLTELTRKKEGRAPDIVSDWNKESSEAFEQIKKCLASAPVHKHPDLSQPFILQTGASSHCVSAILSQRIDGKEAVISYFSRTLSPTQQRYAILEKELLAIMEGTRAFRHYLLAKPFTIVTDSKALTYLNQLKEKNAKLFRYSMELQDFNYTVEYRTTVQNANVDALTRCHDPEVAALEEEKPQLVPLLNQFAVKEAQLMDEHLQPIISEARKRGGAWNSYFLTGQGALYQRKRAPKDPYNHERIQLVIPKSEQERTLEAFHAPPVGTHQSAEKMLSIMEELVGWDSMEKDAKRFVKNCRRCQLANNPRQKKKAPLNPSPIPEAPMTRICMDILGPVNMSSKGNRYICVITDYLTKWCVAEAIPKASAEEVARVLVEKVVYKFGLCKYLITDRGVQFTSELFRAVCKKLAIKQCFSTAYHPQSQGLVEKHSSVLAGTLRKILDDRNLHQWEDYLPAAVLVYNIAVNRTTKASPFFLMFGRKAQVILDFNSDRVEYAEEPSCSNTFPKILAHVHQIALEQIKQAQAKQREYRQKLEKEPDLKEGDQVTLERKVFPLHEPKKFLDRRQGIWIVEKSLPNSVFVIRELEGTKHMKVHADRIHKLPFQPFADPETPTSRPQGNSHQKDAAELTPDGADDEEEFLEPDKPADAQPMDSAESISARTRSKRRPSNPPFVQPRTLEYKTRTQSPARTTTSTLEETVPNDPQTSTHTAQEIEGSSPSDVSLVEIGLHCAPEHGLAGLGAVGRLGKYRSYAECVKGLRW